MVSPEKKENVVAEDGCGCLLLSFAVVLVLNAVFTEEGANVTEIFAANANADLTKTKLLLMLNQCLCNSMGKFSLPNRSLFKVSKPE